MTKISVIGPTHPFKGGISHYTSLLVRTLRRHSSVQFLSYSRQYHDWLYPGKTDRDPSRTFFVEERPDERFDALNPWNWYRAADRVFAHRPDLVILPWSVFYWAPFHWCFLKRLRTVSRIPVLFLCHNVLEHEASRLKSSLSKRVLRMGDYFITHSEWDHRNLTQWLGSGREERVLTTCHPIYEHLTRRQLDKRAARQRLGLESEHVILFFGFIREYKGLRYLMEGLRLVRETCPVHLVVAGEPWGDDTVYRELITRLGLDDAVTLVSRYIPNEEVEVYFAAADLVTVPYVSATQSGIVQLAYGFGKPVLVGRVGGLPEVVDDGKTGYMVTPRDPQAIAKAILDFYTAGRQAEFGSNVERVRSRFSWDELGRTILRLAERATSASHPDETHAAPLAQR
ncbi:MAG: glycosyltransferase [Acidobacteriota bacterium]